MVQLLTDPRVRVYLGGSKPRALALLMAIVSIAMTRRGHGRWAQIIAEPVSGRMLGTVLVDRRRPERPGHVRDEGREFELSYVLLPDAWGRGLAEQACRQLLATIAAELPDQPVLVVTQTTNRKALALAARLGFQRCGEFTEFGARQALLATQLRCFAI